MVAALLLLWFASAHAACAAPGYVDRRVSAIPAAVLLSRDPPQLVDRRRQHVSVQLRRYTRPLFFAWAFSQIVALFYLWTLLGSLIFTLTPSWEVAAVPSASGMP